MKFTDENNNFFFKVLLLTLYLCVSLYIPAMIAQTVDSLPKTQDPAPFLKNNFIKASVVPASLLATGLLIKSLSWPVSDNEVKNWSVRNFGVIDNNYDDYIRYSPAAMVAGLQVCGIKGRNTLFDEGAMLFLSIAIQGTIIHVLKHTTSVERPDQSSFDAFPSSHSSQAFTCATFMHMEYGDISPWYSVAAYTPAAATGAYRILRNRHWSSDVLVGAACGIIVTRVVYRAYPKVKEKICHMFIKRNPRMK